MTLTEKEWEVSPGFQVGMTREQVEAVLGTRGTSSSSRESETLEYYPFTFDAVFWVTLKGDIVVEIGMAEDWRQVMEASLLASLLDLTVSPIPAQTNSPFTLTAIVSGSGPTPTGTVTFNSSSSCRNCGMAFFQIPIESATLDSIGRATLRRPGLSTPGSPTFGATYAGDINYGPSSGSVTQVVTGPTPRAPVPTLPMRGPILLQLLRPYFVWGMAILSGLGFGAALVIWRRRVALLKRGFSFRASTAFLVLALVSLGLALLTGWAGEPLGSERVTLESGALALVGFPVLTAFSSVTSLGYLLVRRRLQHLVELALSVGLLAWILTLGVP